MDFEIPGYNIIERIGSGGMASVYHAIQHTFQRDVALKVLRQDLGSDEKYSERFVQESLIIAKLHHSHIVQVYDVGQYNRLYYVAMEYLSGRNLSELMRLQRIDRSKAVRIFSQIASALDYSHQKGIVHRDVKPDNIMFREDGAAVLTDFGIAKDTDAAMELTQTGTIMGTPKYMSPEQIRGGEVSPSSDLYSLGVVFYQMLTGAVPYSGSTLVEVAVKHLNEPIPTLPDSLSHLQPIFDRILAKKPEERYKRGKEILQDLSKVEHQSIHALLDADDEAELLNDTGEIKGPVVSEPTKENTITNHDGVTLLSLEGIEPGVDATTIRVDSPVSGRFKTNTATANPSLRKPTPSPARPNSEFSQQKTKFKPGPSSFERLGGERFGSERVANEKLGNEKLSNERLGNPTASEEIDTTNWEYLFDAPDHHSAHNRERKNNWGLYSAFAIAIIVLVVGIAVVAPSLGPDTMPELGRAPVPYANKPEIEPQLAEPETETNTEEAATQLSEPEVAETPESSPQPVTEAPQEEIDETKIATLITSARQDEGDGRLTKPLGNNALVKYRQVLMMDGENQEAQLGIGRIADHFVANAERFPSNENMGVAYSVMSDAKAASPGNPYLAAISERLKVVTDSTQANSRHADSLYRKLQVQGLLRSAEIDEREGRLNAPANNNAAEKYRKVLDIDPENEIAAQRLKTIEQLVSNQ